MEIHISNNHCGMLSKTLDALRSNELKNLDYVYDIHKASDRHNSFLLKAVGEETLIIEPIERSFYKKRFFESRHSAGNRYFFYIKNDDILERLTAFVLHKADEEQKDKWNKRRLSFSITIDQGDSPFLLEYLKNHKKEQYALQNN